eukprot:m.150294 g.150294  ORF g.150294 m.150294 type:complete len:688 (+) comp14226_c0_seq2:98-2161(+)
MGMADPHGLAVVECCYTYSIPPIGKFDPQLKLCFPEASSQIESKHLFHFCFPFDQSVPALSIRPQRFTFTLTLKGCLHYGYCIQTEPKTPGSASSLLCIVSKLDWHDFFQSLIGALSAIYTKTASEDVLASILLDIQENHALNLTSALRQELNLEVAGFPKLTFTTPDRKHPRVLTELPVLYTTVVTLSPSNLLQLLASLLAERRVLITCSSLGTLTDVIYCLAMLLFPLSWQHVFLPVLPANLLDYCCATMPFLIGVHSSLIDKAKRLPLESHVFVDLDTDTVESPFNDIATLPPDLAAHIKSTAKKESAKLKVNGMDVERVNRIGRAFLSLFLTTLEGYDEHIDATGRVVQFDVQQFCAGQPKYNMFVQMVASTQLFAQFIANKASGDLVNGAITMADNRTLFDEELYAKQQGVGWDSGKAPPEKLFSKFKSAAKHMRLPAVRRTEEAKQTPKQGVKAQSIAPEVPRLQQRSPGQRMSVGYRPRSQVVGIDSIDGPRRRAFTARVGVTGTDSNPNSTALVTSSSAESLSRLTIQEGVPPPKPPPPASVQRIPRPKSDSDAISPVSTSQPTRPVPPRPPLPITVTTAKPLSKPASSDHSAEHSAPQPVPRSGRRRAFTVDGSRDSTTATASSVQSSSAKSNPSSPANPFASPVVTRRLGVHLTQNAARNSNPFSDVECDSEAGDEC